MENYKLFINGEFTETRSRQRVINPATGEVIAEVCLAGEREAEEAIRAARDAFDSGPWPRLPLYQRKEFMLKIHRGILERAGDLAQLETLNTGKPIKESTFMDIPSSAETFKYFSENLEKFLKGEEVDIFAQTGRAEGHILREPMGVAVLIVPWNYPLLISSWKLAQALAAGNTVILKASSATPLTALELAKIIEAAGLPKGVVNIITGGGDKVGEILCSDKRVDLVSFTGSNEVGRLITGYTARNPKKCIMELGGKSASIIFADADLEAAVNSSLCSIFLNQGQMCTAMSRILVEDNIYDKFCARFAEKASRIKLGDGISPQTQMGPLISDAQRKKVSAFVQKAQKEGAKLLCGGKVPQDRSLKKGFFFEPTVLTDVGPETPFFNEETFGPVAAVCRFSSEAEALRLANQTEFALAACVWSKDEAKIIRVCAGLNAGTVWVNTYGMFYNELPYGGFKQSGFGKELGKDGLLGYTRSKSVVIDRSTDKPLVNYWYGF